MKPFFACIIIVLGLAVTAAALTERWRYTSNQRVFQLVADGGGGCALISIITNDLVRLVWLNKKGNQIMVIDPIGMVFPTEGPIHQCTPRGLLVAAGMPYPLLFQISSKGALTPVATLGGLLLGSPIVSPLPHSVYADRKGFFAININTTLQSYAVIRYTYK